MKTIMLITAMASICAITSCTQSGSNNSPQNSDNAKITVEHARGQFPVPQPPYSTFIPIDSANKMISSYLESIHVTQNDTDLKALIISVDSLEEYVRLARTNKMTNIKLMFAHSLEYINAGNYGIPCGYRSGALTLVVTGYDSSGNYVVMSNQRVLEHSMPCPTNCPIAGTASENLIRLKN